MAQGIDCALDCTTRAAAINNAGVAVVGRYYRWPTSSWTPLTHEEALSLSQVGLQLLALWEWQSDQLSNFGHKNGVDQGSSAYNQALKAGQPPNTPIYFAVDNDYDLSAISGVIAEYFQGVSDAFALLSGGNPSYRIGVYGSGLTCDWLLAHGHVTHTWLAHAPKWRGADTFKTWNVKQNHQDLKIAGLTAPKDYDGDEVNADAGAFQVTV
jgi:hypothetical protein